MYAHLAWLRTLERESSQVVRERQLEKLASTLDYAAANSPYYASRLGDCPGSLGPFQRLRRAPFLTKKDLQEEFLSLQAEPLPGRVHSKTTGGSTGQPVTVLKDAEAIAFERAATWLSHGWFGIEIGDRGARFWGSPQAFGRRRFRFALADLAMNRIRLSAFAVTEARLAQYWQTCLSFQPRYLYGYVSMLERFARYVSDMDLEGHRLGVRCVITTSETLHASQRRLLSEVFQAPVQNEYGCGEVGPIAYECRQGSLHVMSENVFVELLDDEGRPVEAGEEGAVVVTDLNNRAMPLIRYRLEDRAVQGSDCECGRGFPVLGSIRGRQYDFVTTPDGRSFHGEFFMYLFEDLRDAGMAIGNFRIVQTAETGLEIQVQAPPDRSESISSAVRKVIVDSLGLHPTVSVVEEMRLTESGKLRVIENRTCAREPV